MDFYALTGKMALGSRLRRLADSFTNEASQVYKSYNVGIDPRWFPVFFMLCHHEKASISEIAKAIGHSHPSVSQIVKEMTKQGITETSSSEQDSRVNIVKLSDKGKALKPSLDEQCDDVNQAVEQLLNEADTDLWRAIEQIEIKLEEKHFFERVRQARLTREQQYVEIVPYSNHDQKIYAELNRNWIEKHWQLEDADIKALEHPQESILEKGGMIFLAKYKGEVVGSCAMLKMQDGNFELAKMAVSEKVKGKGIGYLLGLKIIEQAKHLSVEKLYLESNTLLVPAINLYKKLGFKQISGISSPYERCNIQMDLYL
ncbi:MAG: GNAT family N-acetyltransferase [Colwelliaceae bacterium]|jgi:DNA-binding MarR family transcriptional regulator/N-acetylglutamate synthase-like GNAT family acetyltransferase|nr:GNAT family N-acetyltransferase [Colwelliaceae bacterium]